MTTITIDDKIYQLDRVGADAEAYTGDIPTRIDIDTNFDEPKGVVCYDDGSDECVYKLPVTTDLAIYYHPRGGTATLMSGGIADYLEMWDWDLWGSLEALLVAFGIEPEIKAAPEDYTGKCKIWRERHYYSGTCGAPEDGWVVNEDEHGQPISAEPRIFPTRAAAQEYVDAYYNEPSGYDGVRQCNVMSHGQYAADTLTIAEA